MIRPKPIVIGMTSYYKVLEVNQYIRELEQEIERWKLLAMGPK